MSAILKMASKSAFPIFPARDPDWSYNYTPKGYKNEGFKTIPIFYRFGL